MERVRAQRAKQENGDESLRGVISSSRYIILRVLACAWACECTRGVRKSQNGFKNRKSVRLQSVLPCNMCVCVSFGIDDECNIRFTFKMVERFRGN